MSLTARAARRAQQTGPRAVVYRSPATRTIPAAWIVCLMDAHGGMRYLGAWQRVEHAWLVADGIATALRRQAVTA